MGFGKTFKKYKKKFLDKPAHIAGKTFYKVSKKVTGSEKFSSAGARMFAVSTSALAGDPLPFRPTLKASDVGADPDLFRSGRQAGDWLGVSIGALFVGGAVAGGGAAGGSGGGAAAGTAAGGTAGGTAAVAGTGTTIATGAGTSTSWWIAGSTVASSLIGSIGSLFKGIAGPVLSDKASQFMNEVFGGSGGSGGEGQPGGTGGEAGTGFFSANKLPFILIGIVLLAAFLLSRKRGR